ncbi:MAG: DUF2283 domain-containing protein [Candidatus Bipolaricaulota bacterium]|nr:DUF2283 domain-containing protein [Candidatus Bipolaricaulota bacterium]
MKARYDKEADARYIRLREAEHGMIFSTPCLPNTSRQASAGEKRLETGYESASKMLNGLIRALKHKEDVRTKG